MNEAERLVQSMVERMLIKGVVSQPELVETIAALWQSIKSLDGRMAVNNSTGIDDAALIARGLPTINELRFLYPEHPKP